MTFHEVVRAALVVCLAAVGLGSNDIHHALQTNGLRQPIENLGPVVNSDGPAARGGHAMAYDEGRGVTLLFGGSGRQGHLNDLWEWDGRQWRFVTATGPTPRNAVVFVYDSRRKRAVLVGGRTAQGLKVDTWEWDTNTWRERQVEGPGIRLHHHGAYDSRRGRLVMYGGLRPVNKTIEPLSDTWEWDGEQWTQRNGRGIVAFPNAMTYDVHRAAVVMSAVEGTMPPDAVRPSALWAWDGTRWTQTGGRFGAPEIAPGQPITSDALGVLLLDGGIMQGRQALTWQWNGASWTRSLGAPPVPQRVSHAMAYDARRKRVVMFGGHAGTLAGRSGEIYGDTWEWDGASWVKMHPR
jgi:hypothetical protein